MPKTLVNIITEDNPIPAYLFIKEMYMEGDRLMYISAKDDANDLMNLSSLFNVPANMIDEIVLKNEMDEITYEKICQTVLKNINKDTCYWVNLAGGTRYMALAVEEVFNDFDSTFFYVQTENNLIVQSIFNDSIDDKDDLFYPIGHRMSIAEYLNIHYIEHDLDQPTHQPIRSKEEATQLFNMFAKLGQKNLRGQDYKVLEMLREKYRGRNKVNLKELAAKVPGLYDFLYRIEFVSEDKDALNKRELDYLTGGWFEEYVYYLVEEYIHPQDLAINVVIARKGVDHINELDVVFTKGNKLFVIECKTGVQTERLFNEIVYKLCAIREALLGVSCFSYIFSLKMDVKNDFKRIADNMDICFIDYDTLINPDKLRMAIMKMDLEAKDR